MISQVGQGTLASCLVLGNKSEEGKHCQTAILNLLELQGGQITLGEVHEIKDATGVTGLISSGQRVLSEDGVLVGTARLAVVLQSNKQAQGARINIVPSGSPQKLLEYGKPCVESYLQPADLHPSHEEELNGEEHLRGSKVLLGTSRPPVLTSQLGSKDTSNTSHSPAAVDELSLYIPLESFGLLTQVQGVCIW